MGIERLKKLIQSEDSDLWDYKEELITLINEAIARQTATTEEVTEAIEILRLNSELEKVMDENGDIDNQPYLNALDLAITALQAYQPTISKTETTSWKMIDSDINLWKCSKCNEEWTFEYGGPEENNMHYCPNCGRRLEE